MAHPLYKNNYKNNDALLKKNIKTRLNRSNQWLRVACHTVADAKGVFKFKKTHWIF